MIDCTNKITNAQLSSNRCKGLLENARTLYDLIGQPTDERAYEGLKTILTAIQSDLEFASRQLNMCMLYTNQKRTSQQYKKL